MDDIPQLWNALNRGMGVYFLPEPDSPFLSYYFGKSPDGAQDVGYCCDVARLHLLQDLLIQVASLGVRRAVICGDLAPPYEDSEFDVLASASRAWIESGPVTEGDAAH